MAYLYLFNRKELEEHKQHIRRKTEGMTKRRMTELPLPWEFATITPLAIVYGIARASLLIEVFAELRDTKGSAYVNVEWMDFLPHV